MKIILFALLVGASSIASAQKVDVRPPFGIKWGMTLDQARVQMGAKDYDVQKQTPSEGSPYLACHKDEIFFGAFPCKVVTIRPGNDKTTALVVSFFLSEETSDVEDQKYKLGKIKDFILETYKGEITEDDLSGIVVGAGLMDKRVFEFSSKTTRVSIYSSYSDGKFNSIVHFLNEAAMQSDITKKLEAEKKKATENARKDL